MSKKNGGKGLRYPLDMIVKAIALGAVVVLIVLIVSTILKYTNGGNEAFKTFYLLRGDEQIFASASTADFTQGKEYEYGVKYTFDFDTDEVRDYKVNIVPNPASDFDFFVNGKGKQWGKEGNFNEAFSLNKQADKFTFSVPYEYTRVDLALAERYEGKTVTVNKVDVERPYMLVVSSYNEGVTFEIAFNTYPTVTDIEFGQGGIVW